jgi:hypothetical protein
MFVPDPDLDFLHISDPSHRIPDPQHWFLSRDILIRIWVRILGSVFRIRIWILLFFGNGFQDVNKNEFFLRFFLLISYCTYINISLQDNILFYESQKGEIMVYLNFLACWWKDPDPDPKGT